METANHHKQSLWFSLIMSDKAVSGNYNLLSTYYVLGTF